MDAGLIHFGSFANLLCDVILAMNNSEPTILSFPKPQVDPDPVVITGIGLCASVGSHREAVWQAVQAGQSGVRLTHSQDPVAGLELPCAMVDWCEVQPDQLKSIQLTHLVAEEALQDAGLDWSKIDRERFGCSIAAQFGDIGYLYDAVESRDTTPNRPWWNQFLPCSANNEIARKHGLLGPRTCHTTACASGLISTMAGQRMIQADQADLMLCGASDAIHEMVIAAFHRMGVLSPGPDASSACRPFDKTRSGFVMGEGAALMVLEKRSHALARGARIYAEIAASKSVGQAHHVTGLDGGTEALEYLIDQLVQTAGWSKLGPQYVNAHGTGTEQNDESELTALRGSLGDLADDLVISSNKAVIGHLINAAGSVELALTALAMRDGFAPPTMHLEQPEPIGALDCLPLEGAQFEIDRALKLSLAFGGHLVGIGLRRTPYAELQRTGLPLSPNARVRSKDAILPGVQRRKAA